MIKWNSFKRAMLFKSRNLIQKAIYNRNQQINIVIEKHNLILKI